MDENETSAENEARPDGWAAFDDARKRVSADFNTLIRDAEELLRAATSLTGDQLAAARVRFRQKLDAAKWAAARADTAARANMTEAAEAATRYVEQHPWTALSIAAGIGFILGRLGGRRSR